MSKFKMFRALKILKLTNQICRNYGKEGNFGKLKVAICGAAGKTGQTVSLLLKACPLIDELALYDVVKTGGIALELNQIDTKCKVYPFKQNIKGALENAKIVAIIASSPTVGETEAGFTQNAEIICEIISCIAQYCPKALVAIATNPVNSLVPLASEVLKHHGVYNPNHIFGITTLDVMRTNSLVAEKLGLEPEKVNVPCIGGNYKTTTVPILSHTKPKTKYTDEELLIITEAVQNAQSRLNDEGCASTYLSGALAISQFIISLARGVQGEQNVVETCYVRSNAYPNMDYLSTPIILGTDGAEKNLGVPEMTDYEKCLFQTAREGLKQDIILAEDYIKLKFSQTCSV